ncbi:MAG: protein phosphatase 2C domain-containing protein, partial [Planctomycetota bacterium]|nr:protein phosphatase 2C domain-containing protein [Planctomycetota bacterium]
MKIAYAALTDVGLVRQNNEDTYLLCAEAAERAHTPPPASGEGIAETNGVGVLLAVADGMGGALAGEVASKMAVEALAEVAKSFDADDSEEQAREKVLQAIRKVNESIYEASLNNPQQRGMGTTLTVALLRAGRVQFFQVGDSKGYIGRDGQLHQMTEDQSLIGKLIHDKVITAEDAEQLEGGRNIILQALGAEPTVKVDVSTSTLAEGDQVLLCTDGLHGCIKQQELEEIVARGADTGKLCEDLVGVARDRGGPDNITVITVTVLEGGEEPRPPGLLGGIATWFGGLFRG